MIHSSKHYILFFLSLLSACGPNARQITLTTGAQESRHYRIGRQLAELLEEKTSYRFELDTLGEGSISNAKRLLSRGSGFALAQNDVPLSTSQDQLRTVLPLYPQLLLVVYKDSLEPTSLRDLIVGRKIAIGPRQGGTAAFSRHFLQSMGIDSSEYRFYYSHYQENHISDSIPISISVTGYNNARIQEMLVQNKGKLWSLDQPELMNQGSVVDGFCLQYPYARPFIIPKNTYQTFPEEPILTIALENVLLAHQSLDDEVVYEVVKTLVNNRESLRNKEVLFRFIRDDFDKSSLQFPLHAGAERYLNRNQPTFFERYAEILALILTILTVGIGSASTVWRWNRRRKKDRIDQYYLQVIQMENQAKDSHKIEELDRILEDLDLLRQKAFTQLTAEKLEADDSFRIFITLIQDVSAVIEKRMLVLRESP